jgi:hypothetical protein
MPKKAGSLSQSKSSQYEEVLQKIHSSESEFLRQKWRDVLAFLEARDHAKRNGLEFPPRKKKEG